VTEAPIACTARGRPALTRDTGAWILDITGPPDAQPVIRQFFATPGA
jgi:hypothetical protein